ncbi:DUF1707 domain-containing protein [Nocardioides sp. J2M5]|uniref:DUF1707 SHOCT-like domain-containing protein n=1 Tax=Nocardioides palaemonis TaxID=2829810 RepID=UPI001BA8F4A0|nr:DUF1707 domain-containing protein [Nocardioides palaemonis]MBS2939068.1 DUF1707 domain-containing protein [Nocardioides palaemonis]
MRVSDGDRERAMADLATHYAEGRLDHEEYDERLDAIWTARTRADLAVLFGDLPRPVAPQPQARTPQPRSQRRRRFPLLPVLAVLIVLSAVTDVPFWLLVFPLWFLLRRGGCGQQASHAHAAHGDYRRPRRSSGW